MVYNRDHRVLQYCDGATWRALMARPAGSSGSCENPVRAEGTIIYNADQNVPQICSGVWVALGFPNPGAGSGGCTDPIRDEGTIIYNEDAKLFQYCDGENWKRLHGPPPPNCPNVGDTCADGSVYVGLSPDGDTRMYVHRCDLGMTFDGVNCIGARDLLPWNNGNDSGYISTGIGSSITGAFNTAQLILLDSDSNEAGIQPHQAAHACADLNMHGRSDWYLPAPNEAALYLAIWSDPIYGFASSPYWTSRESSDWGATQRNEPGSGSGTTSSKQSLRNIRCARKD